MTTTKKPTHLGRCGIHLFADPERARARRCEVCAEACAFAIETSRVAQHNRNWTPEHRAKMATRMDAQKRAMQGFVAVHRAERSRKATDAALASEETTKRRNAVSGRFEPAELEPTG